MTTIKVYLKPVAFALSFLILLQGCTVYKSTPVSLEQASQIDASVRVITKNDEKLKFDRIIKDNDTYYAINNKSQTNVGVPIDTMQVREIKIKDKAVSTVLIFGVFFIPVLVVAAIVTSSNMSN